MAHNKQDSKNPSQTYSTKEGENNLINKYINLENHYSRQLLNPIAKELYDQARIDNASLRNDILYKYIELLDEKKIGSDYNNNIYDNDGNYSSSSETDFDKKLKNIYTKAQQKREFEKRIKEKNP